MTEVKVRREIIKHLLEQQLGLGSVTINEFCYLQFRMMCELIALGCLAAHGDIQATRTGRMRAAYHADLIFKQLENLHPDFFPVPARLVTNDQGIVTGFEQPTGDIMTKAELSRLYGECGDNLHRGSLKNLGPLSAKHDHAGLLQKQADRINKIQRLLTQHRIQLADPKKCLFVTVQPDGGQGVLVELMERNELPSSTQT